MVKEIQYTSIHRVFENLFDHPMLQNITLEQAVKYALKFISKHGYSKLYEDRIADVDIYEFRGMLPCDLISITQVKDLRSGICLRAMTDSFPAGMQPDRPERPPRPHGPQLPQFPQEGPKPPLPKGPGIDGLYIPPLHPHFEEPSFKTQGQVIYTSFSEGKIQIAYRAIPVDEDGFPLLIDNDTYLDALESFIKMKVFEVKFDQQKIPAGVFQNAQQQYYAAARLLQSEFTLPSPSEAEALARLWNTMIPKVRQFDRGYKHLGSREYLRNQNKDWL